MEEEHLHHPCIVFQHFRKHKLKLKPTKWEFFKNEINYFAHHISKEGVQSSKENLTAMARFTPPQMYTNIQAFLGLVGHYWWFIKGFTFIAQPVHEHMLGEGTNKKNKHVTFMEDVLGAFKMLNKACFVTPVLVFANLK